MSVLFECGDVVVWDAATNVARVYYAMATQLGEVLETPTGLQMGVDDTCQVGIEQFSRYAQIAFDRYNSSSHPILRGLMHGQILVTLVLAERIGCRVHVTSGRGDELLAEAEVYQRSMSV